MLTSDKIFGVIRSREADLRRARIALDEARAMPGATELMLDAAYRAVESIQDHLETLKDDFFATLDAEEAVSGTAAEAVFDVPGTFTLDDVSRPAPNETYDERVIRLARKAVMEGCKIVHQDNISAYVTSSQNPNKTYWVGIDLQESRCACECDGFLKGPTKMCKHLALVMVQRGIVNPATDIAA